MEELNLLEHSLKVSSHLPPTSPPAQRAYPIRRRPYNVTRRSVLGQMVDESRANSISWVWMPCQEEAPSDDDAKKGHAGQIHNKNGEYYM